MSGYGLVLTPLGKSRCDYNNALHINIFFIFSIDADVLNFVTFPNNSYFMYYQYFSRNTCYQSIL